MQTLTWTEVLPIDAHLPRIVEAIRDNPVVIVEAETGAGKTTRIPQAIAELLDEYICMTLPRRSALQPIGERIAAEMGTTPGDQVGWMLAREASVMGPDTRVTLQVTQSMVNWIIEGGMLPEGVLIIDEAHERSIPIDLLLGLVKSLLPRCPKTKVVVTSATIDTERFKRFFERDADDRVIREVPVIKVEGKCFPVEVRPYELQKHEHHSDGAAAAAIEELQAFASSGGRISVAGGFATKGSVDVLLPGVDDIREAASKLRKEADRYPGMDVEILTVASKSSKEDFGAIFSPVPEGALRFVLGTEVLRSSITDPNCVVVIDSLQIKRRVCDENGVGHLKKISVSRAEADQGRGRAGRTANGAYRPIVLKDEFDHLEPYPIPAIVREPIAAVVLQIAYCGLDARFFELPDQPKPETIDAAVARLQRLGLLDDRGVITELGREIVNLPVDPDRGMALMAARNLGVLPEVIIAVAALEQGNIFSTNENNRNLSVSESAVREIMARLKWDGYAKQWVPAEEPQDLATLTVDFDKLPSWITPKKVKLRNAKSTPPALWDVDCTEVHFPHEKRAEWLAGLARIRWAGNTQNDFVAVVRAWRDYMAMSRLLTGPDLRDWCRGYGIDYRRIQFTTDMVRQLGGSFKVAMADLCQHRKFRSINLTKALLAGLFDNLGVNASGLKLKHPQYDSRLGRYTVLFQSAAHGVVPLVLAGGVRRTKQGNRKVADLAARVDPTWLDEMLPHLWELKETANEEQGFFNGVLVRARPLGQCSPAPIPAPAAPAAPPASNADVYDWSEVTEPPDQFEPAPEPKGDPTLQRDIAEFYEAEKARYQAVIANGEQLDQLAERAQLIAQHVVAEQIADLYPVVEEHMPDGLMRHRLLAMMRQHLKAPATPDKAWTEDARSLLALAKLRAPAASAAPKKGRNKKKDR
ncbi:MAG TPA: hypothetical protein VJ843_05775 [Candidatus Saccharimonadales bacterium]|nr:hypothetical protein [Candidatus Saccharimonadales bacterium]